MICGRFNSHLWSELLIHVSRRHLLKDIEPYVCLFPDCEDGAAVFKSPDEWLGHMQWQHTIVWSCQVAGHEEHTFNSPAEMEQHILECHSGSFTSSQLPELIHQSSGPAPDTFAALSIQLDMDSRVEKTAHKCPMCEKILEQSLVGVSGGEKAPETIQDHLLNHLESIALLSIPFDDRKGGGSAKSDVRQSSDNGEAGGRNLEDLPAANFENDDDGVKGQEEEASMQQLDLESDDTPMDTSFTYETRWREVFTVIKVPSLPEPENDALLLELSKSSVAGASRKHVGSDLDPTENDDELGEHLVEAPKFRTTTDGKNLHLDLQEAVYANDEEGVLSLLGISPNLSLAAQRQVALKKASSQGLYGVAFMLLSHDSGLDAANEVHQDALIMASQNGHENIVRLLFERSLLPSEWHGIALGEAAFEGHAGVVRMLLEKGVNVNACNERFVTALHAAAVGSQRRQSQVDKDETSDEYLVIVKMLLSQGADADAEVTTSGQTVLTAAARSGRGDIVDYLLAANPDGKRMAAIEAAIAVGHADIWNRLVGIDLGHSDDSLDYNLELTGSDILRAVFMEANHVDKALLVLKFVRRFLPDDERSLLDHGTRDIKIISIELRALADIIQLHSSFMFLFIDHMNTLLPPLSRWLKDDIQYVLQDLMGRPRRRSNSFILSVNDQSVDTRLSLYYNYLVAIKRTITR